MSYKLNYCSKEQLYYIQQLIYLPLLLDKQRGKPSFLSTRVLTLQQQPYAISIVYSSIFFAYLRNTTSFFCVFLCGALNVSVLDAGFVNLCWLSHGKALDIWTVSSLQTLTGNLYRKMYIEKHVQRFLQLTICQQEMFAELAGCVCQLQRECLLFVLLLIIIATVCSALQLYVCA